MLIEAKNKFITSHMDYIEAYAKNHFSINDKDLDDAKRLFKLFRYSNDNLEYVNIGTNQELQRVCYTSSNYRFNTNNFIYHILSYVNRGKE